MSRPSTPLGRARSRSGTRSPATIADRAVHKIADHRDAVQKKTFTKWVNNRLLKRRIRILDLYEELRDGENLLQLLEVLCGVQLPRERGQLRFHMLQNVQTALEFLESRNIKLVNIRSDDIVDGNTKLTLGLVWIIILHFQISDLDVEVAGKKVEELTPKDALLVWAQKVTQGYPKVEIKDFSSSWRDGFAFNAIIHRYRPDLVDFSKLNKTSPEANVEYAFHVAEKELHLPHLLEVPPNFENSSLSPGLSRSLLQSGQTGSQANLQPQSSSTTISTETFNFPDEDTKNVNDPNQEWAVLNKYLQDKELLQVINSWLLLIAGQEELPYNPYPNLVWYARRQAERFHLFFEEEDTILQKLDCSAYNVGDHVARTHEEPARWGLPPLLKAVNTKALEKFDWLLTSIPSDVSHLDTRDAKYIVHETVPVLTGPCIFLGSLYPDIPLVQVNLEYGIAGPRKEHAVEMFAELVLSDVKRFEEEDVHILLGVLVPEQDDQGWSYSTWTYQNLLENQEEFLFMVQAATRNQKTVILECLFRLDPNSQHYYKRGEIVYNLTFMRVESDRVVSESPMPYFSAYQGVFKSHSSLVKYLAWFENVEKPEKPPQFREPTTSTNKRSSIFFTRGKKTSNTNPLPSITSTTTTSRTALGGPSGATESSLYHDGGPYAEHVRERMRKHLLQNIASFPGHENLFVVLHNVILLLLFNRDQDQAENGLVEACRLLQSTLYKMYLLIEENTFLQSLVSRFTKQESADSYAVQVLYLEYRQHLKDLLCNELQERSIGFTVAGQVLLDRLNAITVRQSLRASSSEETGTLPLNTQVIYELRVINKYCLTLMLGLVDDALVFCPTLKQYFSPIDTSGHSLLTNYTFKHGVEQQSILHQDKTLFCGDQTGSDV